MIRVLLMQGKGSAALAGSLFGQMEVDLVQAATLPAAQGQALKHDFDVILAPASGCNEPPEPGYVSSLIQWNRKIRMSGESCAFLLYFPEGTSCILIDISSGIYSVEPDNSATRALLTIIRQASSRGHLERSFRIEYDILNRVLDEMPLACLRTDTGIVSGKNPAMERLSGYGGEGLIGQQIADLLCIIDNEGNQGYSGTLRDVTGAVIPVRVHRKRIAEQDKASELIFVEDRREIEMLIAEMRETEQSCREKLWLSETLVLKINPDGIITFANNASLRCFGYPSGLSGHHISLLLKPGMDPGSSPVNPFLGVANESEPSSIHIMEHLREDGRKIYIAWTTRAYYSPAGDLTGLLCIGSDMTEQTPEGEERISTRIWRDKVLENTDILPEVFDSILQACVEIAREGREGKPVGTAFFVGDRDAVMERSRQLILNPFFGHPPDMRMVTRKDVREMLKEYAMLDGAFIVSGEGMLEAAGRYITVDASHASLPKGMGTRHSSAAAITRVTRTVGLVVSESGGRVSVIKEGKIVKVIG